MYTFDLLAKQADLRPDKVAFVDPNTNRLDRMCHRGLVVREPDATNRTRVLVTLTDAGWDLFATAIREANVVESDTLASLSRGQRTELASLLEIVISGLDDLDPHPMKPPPLP